MSDATTAFRSEKPTKEYQRAAAVEEYIKDGPKPIHDEKIILDESDDEY